ncbi:MAG: NUDIX domain-containing protein [Anaerolineales bacterium]|jgi:8-oxo-dGTP diphosphatase|nr:NUDIX domain-containing protein [Anaerolineales bacterium]
MSISDQGSLTGRYTLVPRSLIFITQANQVLLLKGSPEKKLWAGLYNGLGGHVERGEDVISSARRELREEAGIETAALWLCGVITIDTGQASGIAIFVLRGESPVGQLHSSSEGDLEWVQMDQIDHLPVVEDLPELLKHTLAVQPGKPPFSAHYQAWPGEPLRIRYAEDG